MDKNGNDYGVYNSISGIYPRLFGVYRIRKRFAGGDFSGSRRGNRPGGDFAGGCSAISGGKADLPAAGEK